jgi:homoserine O-acetyltransferase
MSFQWAVGYPDFVDGIAVLVSSPTGGKNPKSIQRIVDALAKDPNWNGGWYYDRGGVRSALTDIHVATLKSYGIEIDLVKQYPDATAREAEIRRRAVRWAETFDGNSLVVQRKAMEFRDHTHDFGRIKAKVLYILATTDKLFPPSLAPGVMRDLKAAGVDATYVELESSKGHMAGAQDARKYEQALRAFLARL